MKEFRVSILNQPGQLALVTAALSQKLINIRTVSGFGHSGPIITFITDNDEKATNALDELGLSFEVVEALTITLSDHPGELAKVTKTLGDANINIDSIYVLSTHEGHTNIAMTVSDVDKAKSLLGI